METVEQVKQGAADLHWLAILLTGHTEMAADVIVEAIASAGERGSFFSTWMHTWSRRIVIAKALAAVREDLARSARRTELRRCEKCELPPRTWVLDRETTKADLECALLRIDAFPRAAVLLLALERMPLNDAAILLNSEPGLVRTAMAAGLRDLTVNLARMQGWQSGASQSRQVTERQHV